jgi:hypothetical protein
MSQQFTKAEVAQHKDEKSMFIIVDDGVYDISGMLSGFWIPLCPWNGMTATTASSANDKPGRGE